MKYVKTLSDVATKLGVSYAVLYKDKHRPEFIKSSRGYNVDKIAEYLNEKERIKEEEAVAENLLEAENELIEKQIKLETAKHKCRLLELQIKQKEGNLVDVEQVLDTRAKEISLLRKNLTEMVKNLPKELKDKDEDEIRSIISSSVNNILSSLVEFISDDWTDTNDEEINDYERNEDL